jgi:hypothetical protein
LIDTPPDGKEDLAHDVIGLVRTDATAAIQPHGRPMPLVDGSKSRVMWAVQLQHLVFLVGAYVSGTSVR